jgi:hypothetical protein
MGRNYYKGKSFTGWNQSHRGRKNLENKEVTNRTLLQHLKDAEESICEWHKDTFNAMKKKPRQSDLILMGVLFIARKHALGILKLIKEGHLLPAQALLRVLIEVHIKFHWVIRDLKIRTEENNKEIDLRLQQLDKKRVEDDKKLIKDLDETRWPQKNEILNRLEDQLTEYERRGIEKSPDIASICRELDKLAVLCASNNEEPWTNTIYPELYRRYSRAIHSDLGLIRKFVTNKDNKIFWHEDVEDDPEDIINYVLTIIADINKLFLNYYK